MRTYRESPFTLGCWLKLTITVGLYFFWWLAKKITIDNRRVTLQSGVLSKDERSIPLGRVQDVGVRQSLLGRMFNYGNVRIESAGGGSTEIQMNNVSNPRSIRYELVEKERDDE